MHHAATLISTMSVGLVFAFAAGLAAVKLRLPPLIGYLAAGIVVGPFTPGFVADTHLAPQLAELGVILLMFGVGMHFSLKDMMAVRHVAVPGALLQVLIATAMGFAVGRYWEMPPGQSLVFGITLSIASTVVMIRALERHDAMRTEAGRVAVGWLVTEDVVTVLILVMLPVLAPVLGGHAPEGDAASGRLVITLALTLAKAAAFIGFMLVVGGRVLPWLLDFVERTRSRELFTVAIVAIALGVAYGSAELLNLSYALGAFFAGVVLRDSDHSERVSRDVQPLTDGFSVLFFVAVGMLFDPAILVRQPAEVAAAVAVLVIAKPLLGWALLRIFGQTGRVSLTVGAGLGQMGEFSFILLALGQELGLLTEEAKFVLLAAALISIVVNPLLMRLARP